MSFLKTVFLKDLALKAKIRESKPISAKTKVLLLSKSWVKFQIVKKVRDAASPLIRKITRVHCLIGLFIIGSFGFLGDCSIIPSSSCSVVRAMSGKPSSTRLIHKICAAKRGKGKPKAIADRQS